MEAPQITGGGARYNTVERPRRLSIVQWAGTDPYMMTVPILFDGWMDERIVEADIARLNQMARSPGDGSPPPTVKIDGLLPVKGAKWIIQNPIAWGENVIWDKRGRMRQDAIVNLVQFVEEERLFMERPSGKTKTVKAKQGEALVDIAKREYGDVAKGVQTLKRANDIRDPKSVTRNQDIRVPK